MADLPLVAAKLALTVAAFNIFVTAPLMCLWALFVGDDLFGCDDDDDCCQCQGGSTGRAPCAEREHEGRA